MSENDELNRSLRAQALPETLQQNQPGTALARARLPESSSPNLGHGLWTTYGVVAARGLSLVSNLMLARLLLPGDYGIIGVAHIFWALANLFTQGTVDSFVVYHGIEDRKTLNAAYTLSGMMGGSIALALGCSAPAIANFFKMPELTTLLPVFAFNLLLSFAYSFCAGVLRRQLSYQTLAQISLLASLLRVLVSVGAALLGLGYWAFALGDLCFWSLSVLLAQRAVNIPLSPEFSIKTCRTLIIYCCGAIASSFGFYVNANFDSLLVGRMLGQEELGYYNFAYQVTLAACLVFTQITQQFGTSVFAYLESHVERQQALENLMGHLAFGGAFVFGFLALILNDATITFVFHEKWMPACRLIPWLLIFAYFRLLNSPLGALLAAVGKPDVSAKAHLLIAPIAAFSFAVGATWFGSLGVAIAVASVLGGGWTLCWWLLGCQNLNWPLLPFLRPTVGFGGMALGIVILCSSLPLSLRPWSFSALYFLLSLRWSAPYWHQYYRVVKEARRRFD